MVLEKFNKKNEIVFVYFFTTNFSNSHMTFTLITLLKIYLFILFYLPFLLIIDKYDF